ncbi:MAG: MFS transporter [Acidimicrobiales bacterium]
MSDTGQARVKFVDLLRESDFRGFWLGQSISSLGNSLYSVAIVLFILATRHSVALLGLALGAKALGGGGASLIGGFLADRWPRVRVLLLADVVRGAAVTALAFMSKGTPGGVILAATFILGAGEAVFLPAYTAVIPALVGRDRLQAANAANSLSVNVGQVLGPITAAALITVVAPRGVFLIDAGSFAVSIATLLRIRHAVAPPVRPPARVSQHAVQREPAGGVREIMRRPWLAASILSVSLFTCVGLAPLLVMLPVVAKSTYAHSTYIYGVWLTLYGAGSIFGSWISNVRPLKRPGLLAQLGLLPVSAVLVLLATSLPALVIAVGMSVAGAGYALFGVLWTTALHRDVPSHLLGRVAGIDAAFALVLMPLGYAGTGLLAGRVGVAAVLLPAAGVSALLTALPLFVRGGTQYRTLPSGIAAPKPLLIAWRSETILELEVGRPLSETSPPGNVQGPHASSDQSGYVSYGNTTTRGSLEE